MPPTAPATPLVLLHGACHGSWCWSEVTPYLAAAGRIAVAVDMAGHGLKARHPRWPRKAYDLEAAATEVSPVADVTLDAAAELLTSQIRLIGGGGPVTVVAHSMSGVVLTRVAQRTPELVARAVYLAAYMPASGKPVVEYEQHPETAGNCRSQLSVADPAQVGAMRLNPGSDDPDYRRLLYGAFFRDVDPDPADAAIALLTPDLPADMVTASTTLTSDGWGSVPRTYIACTHDDLGPLPARFIAEADAAFPDNPTSVVSIDTGHAAFLSRPRELAAILAGQC